MDNKENILPYLHKVIVIISSSIIAVALTFVLYEIKKKIKSVLGDKQAKPFFKISKLLLYGLLFSLVTAVILIGILISMIVPGENQLGNLLVFTLWFLF